VLGILSRPVRNRRKLKYNSWRGHQLSYEHRGKMKRFFPAKSNRDKLKSIIEEHNLVDVNANNNKFI